MRILTIAVLLCLCCFVSADQRIDTIKAFTGKYCADCHDEDIQKGGLDLTHFDLSISSLEEEHIWSYSYGRVARMEMPPAEKKKQPTAEEREKFKKALSSLLDEKILNKQRKFGRTVLRRLTREEYENTLKDLLQVPDLEVKHFLPEDAVTAGFDNVANGQTLSHINIQKYLEAADFALDMAASMGEKPEKYKFAQDMIKSPRLNPFTKKNKNRRLPVSYDKKSKTYHYRYKQRDNPFPIIVHALDIPYQGDYSIKFRAFGSQYNYKELKALPEKDSTKHHVMSLYIGVGNQKDQAGVFSLPNNKCKKYFKLTFPMQPGDEIFPQPSSLITNLPKPPDFYPNITESVGIQDFIVEGPIINEWPTKSHKFLYEDLKQVPWTQEISEKHTPLNLVRYKSRDLSKPHLQAISKLTLVSENPEQDAKFLLQRFMTKAFRRPVDAEELNEFYAYFQSRQQAGFDFMFSLKATYKLILCDPSFLYFEENIGELNDYALASRLSYFLWRSMPDDKLRTLANEGKLRNSEVLKAEVERLLNSPKSQNFTKNFVDQWLDLKNFFSTAPDKDLYPEYHSDHWIEYSMMKETYSFFDTLVKENLSTKNIIDSDFIMINQRLASHYGLPPVKGDEIRQYKLPEGSNRGGFLTQGSILKVTANGTTTSPVNRGVWLAEKILGLHIPPPPANVPAIEEDSKGTVSLKERLAKHRNIPSCAGCHTKTDPQGFALEGFDVMGKERDYYRLLNAGKTVDIKEHFVPVKYKRAQDIDSSSTAPNGQNFNGINEFKAIAMQDHKKVREHFLKQLIKFASGGDIQFTDRAEIDRIMAKTSEDEGIRTLIHHITQSQLFRHK